MSKLPLLARGAILAAILALFVVPPAIARVQNGLDLVVETIANPAKSGQTFTARLRVVSDRPLQVTEFTLVGDQWNDLAWSDAAGKDLTSDAPLSVDITGKPSRADAPLTVIIRAGNKALRRTLILGGAEYERRAGPLPAKIIADPGPSAWASQWARSLPVQPAPPRPDPQLDAAVDDQVGDAPPPESTESRTIRIRGRFIYLRDGTTVMGADGMTVHVYDDDPIVDDHLGSSVTDIDGNFDFTIQWESQVGQTHPDLLLKLLTENTEVQVRDVGSLYCYRFEFGPWNNFSGDDLNLGVGIPAHEADHAIPHLITNYTRNWRYLIGNGHDTRFLEVRWPGSEDDGAYYNDVSETIQLARSDQWQSGTQSHEFGHHVMHCLSSIPDFDYCNGMCDDDEPWDCGHCRWCREEVPVAWSEGWANYLGHTIPRTFDAAYGIPCINASNFALAETCSQDGTWDDPLITEGYTAAALADIEDGHWDDDPRFPGFDDRADLNGRWLLDVLDSDHAMTTTAYLNDLMEHYPSHKEDLWWTAMNNGFNLDTADPDPVYPIVCTSHTVDVPSANPDLSFYWQRPDDDASGVRGYGFVLSGFGYPVDPGPFFDQEGTSTTFSGLAPGTYYFSIRTVDWDGNWDDDYTSIGPFIITPPQPLNLAFQRPTGWDFEVVPRNTPDATLTSCPLPETLDSMEMTYWNVAARNEGDLEPEYYVYTALEVDGVKKDDFNWGVLPPWSPFIVMNEGPELVVGGLHTISGSLDPDQYVSETDESDNRLGKQFAWRPPLIDPNTVYSNGLGVPDATGGWETLASAWAFYNCYGMTFNSSGWWNAFIMWADNPDLDYDLRLHEVNEDPLGGFLFATEVSSQPAGWVDAVLVNRNTMGQLNWDAAVLDHHDASGMHRFQHVRSAEVAYDDSLSEIMSTNEYVLLREFEVDYLETGGISLDLWTDPPQADVSFSWRDTDFTTGDILEADATALTGADGHAHLEVEALEMGYTCLMICRQPKDGDDDLRVSYRIRPTLPDLRPAQVAGWHAPIVPRADEAGSPTSVAMPTLLLGDQTQTWFNYAVENNSTGTAWGAMRFYVRIDEGAGSFSELHYFDFDGGQTKVFNDDGPRLVNAGRHTVVLDLDKYDYMIELDESNNTYGEQYVWTPGVLASNQRETRMTPPDMVAGWSEIQTSEPVYYNCDGVRAAYTNAFWRAIAVMPQVDTDVDLRLHEVQSDAKTGFGSNLVRSSWGPGQSDYVLVNFNLTANRAFDAGVLAVNGRDDYSCEVLNEYWLGTAPLNYGAVTMGPGEMLDVYEIELPVGNWKIEVRNSEGTVDWGLTVHPGDEPYLNKADVLGNGAAWLAPGGSDEQVTVSIETETYYAFTVWKVGTADLDQTGVYKIVVSEGAVSPVTDDGLPAAPRVSRVYPNPFNPQTTIEFELARSSTVELAVYDLTGRKVATLVQDRYPAGRHEQVWRGLDGAGRPVASGMYVVRMQTGQTTDLKKVMLLK
jgi:hypothetical protein